MESNFTSDIKGNKYSHKGNIITYENQFGEIGLDSFVGVNFGNFPFKNEDLYGGDVMDFKSELTTNFTFSIKSEILNFLRFEYEFEFVPFILKFGFDTYETMTLGDNCMWFYYGWNSMQYETRIRKKIKECGFNLKTLIDEAEDISSIFENISNSNII